MLHAPPTANGDDAAERRRRRANRWHTLRSVFAAFRLAKQPDAVKYVFMMGNAQDEIAEGQRSRGRMRDPFSSPELEAMWQARYCPPRYDLERLIQLPPDTLGGAYARHMKANGLRPDFYEDVAPRHRTHYLRMRMRQTHDIWHLLTGFGTDEFGEVGLQGFYLGQYTNGQSAIIGAGAMLKSVLRARLRDLERHAEAFCTGYCAGRRAAPLLAVRWEELWAEKVEDLRRRYRITVPSGDPDAG
ncbi:MAG TPA: Coq4 family protein [Burkholderiales bacterium]